MMGRSTVLADRLFDSSVDASVVQFGLGDYTAVDGLVHWLVGELFDWSVVVRFDDTASVDGSFAALVDGMFNCVRFHRLMHRLGCVGRWLGPCVLHGVRCVVGFVGR